MLAPSTSTRPKHVRARTTTTITVAENTAYKLTLESALPAGHLPARSFRGRG